MRGNECTPRGFATPSWAYQLLPDPPHGGRDALVHLERSGGALPRITTQHMQEHLDFGLVAGRFTIAYQPPDLSLPTCFWPLPSPPPRLGTRHTVR